MAQYRRIFDIILLMQESEGRKTELRYLVRRCCGECALFTK